MSYQQEVFSFISSIIGQSNTIPIPVEFVRFTGDFNTAAILTQLIYWQGKGSDPDGWIYKSYPEWEEETALSKHKATRAVNALKKMELIDTKVKKVNGNPTLHYLFHHEVFVDLFGKHLQAEAYKKELKAASTLVSTETVLSKIRKPYFPNAGNRTNLPIEQKTTSKDYDDVPNSPAPSKADPVPEVKEPSSSFSKEDLKTLTDAVPEERRSKAIEDRLQKALATGLYSIVYLLDCIAYSHDKATKDFVGYLGNCIDKDYASEGYHKQQAAEAEKRRAAEARRKDAAIAEAKKRQERAKKDEEMKRKYEFLDNLWTTDPERYFELKDQACETLGIDPANLKSGDRMRVKFEIMRILEL